MLTRYCCGSPARVLINLLMLCATLNDSVTEEASSSPSPQVAVIIARCASIRGYQSKTPKKTKCKEVGEGKERKDVSIDRHVKFFLLADRS